ncbi:HIT family protein [Streptomyces fagopyri]|uniref:HIT family protein n=1 Tax=Streptomyces fagopyri TaxID=2662397 RepID=UPI0036CBEDC2
MACYSSRDRTSRHRRKERRSRQYDSGGSAEMGMQPLQRRPDFPAHRTSLTCSVQVIRVTLPVSRETWCLLLARKSLADAATRRSPPPRRPRSSPWPRSIRTGNDVVTETDRVLAFHHTRPAHPVHIVVVPKEHVPSLLDLGDDNTGLLLEVMEVVRKVARKVRAEHGAASITTNEGLYQESKHMHWHVCHRGENEQEDWIMRRPEQL